MRVQQGQNKMKKRGCTKLEAAIKFDTKILRHD